MIKELLSKGLKYSLANPEEFAKAYKEAFGEKVCSYCPGIIQEKFNQLLKTDEQTLITMKSRKWKMIPGKLIDTLMSSTGPCGQYTDKNITDEIAEQLISKGYGSYFLKNASHEEIEQPVTNDSLLNQESEENDISFEVFEKSVPGETKKDSFGTYSFTKLVKYCESKKFPKAEYENLNRQDLIEYVRNK
jgi:hypothetical protein